MGTRSLEVLIFGNDKEVSLIDIDTAAEAPGRRRVQKAPPSAKQMNTSSIPSKNNPEPRTTLATRRRLSVRDQKAPLGPRPREFSPSKR